MNVEYLQGPPPPSVDPFTHTNLHTQVLGTIHCGGRIWPLQSSLLMVFYTRPRGVGSVFLPWGMGLKGLSHKKWSSCCHTSIESSWTNYISDAWNKIWILLKDTKIWTLQKGIACKFFSIWNHMPIPNCQHLYAAQFEINLYWQNWKKYEFPGPN